MLLDVAGSVTSNLISQGWESSDGDKKNPFWSEKWAEVGTAATAVVEREAVLVCRDDDDDDECEEVDFEELIVECPEALDDKIFLVVEEEVRGDEW